MLNAHTGPLPAYVSYFWTLTVLAEPFPASKTLYGMPTDLARPQTAIMIYCRTFAILLDYLRDANYTCRTCTSLLDPFA